MSEMTSVVEQQHQQYICGSSNEERHCKDCGLYFESGKSLDVHLRYHQENLLSQWASQAQQEESNNNNSKAGNHNSSHPSQKAAVSVIVPVDSSESVPRSPSEGPIGSATATASQQLQQPVISQSYGHFSTPMFSDSSYFMQNDQSYILPHHFSPDREDSQHGASNYSRYHPYQHQHFSAERLNSDSSTSPRSTLQCDKCGAIYDDANQLGEHVRSSHPTSPNSYPVTPQYQQLGGSSQQQVQQLQSNQTQQSNQLQLIHASSPHSNNQQQDYNFGRQIVKLEVKQEPEEQAEILDLDSHKVQTHR